MTTNSLTEKEIQRFRTETKGTTSLIHFNNAGSSLPPDIVVDTAIDYLKEEAMHGGYETESKYKDQLEKVYSSIAQLINASVDEIALVENASLAWGIGFNGIAFERGDEIIISEFEYVTNLIGFVNAQKTKGVEIKVVPNDLHGNFSLSLLEEAISSKTKLIAMTHLPSTAGGMIPIIEIGQIARRHNILYLLDACQTAGQLPIDVKGIQCDMLSATGRKYLRAPRGTGFLYVRKEVQDKIKMIFADGFSVKSVSENDFTPRDDAKRFELYEKNRALVIGLGKAVDYALNIGLDRIWERIQFLATYMRDELRKMEGVIVHDKGDDQTGIVTFSVKLFESSEVKNKLARKNINVSVAVAKSALIYMNKHHLKDVVRASVHYYNTEAEIDEMILTILNF